MAYEATVIAGSGINPLKKDLPAHPVTGRAYIKGTSVVVLNPEDASAGGSGLVTTITLDATTVQIPLIPLRNRRAMSICNNHASEKIYIGFSPNLLTGTGWPIPAGATQPLQLNGDVIVYAIGDTTGMDVRVLELS